MQQAKQPKVFAFKLAEKKTTPQNEKLAIRQGVTHAGCSGPESREVVDAGGTWRGRDNGYYC